jgi:serine/threonine protein kinase/tetratricopeptide (TPR) repeat protein
MPGEDGDETVFSPPSRPSRPPTIPPSDRPEADTTGLPVSAGGKAPLGPLQIGQQFGARYHILKQLGIGGMGAVYQAWDAELEVAVALKVIRPEVSRDPAAAQDIERRFKQELLLARQVTHRNVVRIHDLGEIDGIKYITMPYIEGSDLSTVLRDSKLSVSQVLPIARQIAAGLQAAHEAGVVHRDLKPANVMIEQEHAIIMDFGIARSTSRGGAPPKRPSSQSGGPLVSADNEMTRVTTAATVIGEIVGTIEYMAPEQARGEHVDQRVDIYAFGLIVYDMLAGRRRVEQAPSAVFELQKRMAQPPRPIRSVVPEVPEPLDKLVTQCIEPDANKRFQTAVELVAALDRLDDNGKLKPKKRVVRMPVAVAVALALLTLSGYIYYVTRPPVTHDPISVVIADFENGTGDSAFDRTLEPMLRRGLEVASFINAYDRSRIAGTFNVQPPAKMDEAAARELAVKQGVGFVLSGSVNRRGNQYEISVKATQPLTGEEIAATQGRAASKDDVLATATRLVTTVREALGDDTSDSRQLLAMKNLSTTSMDVARHYAAATEAQSNGKYEDARQSYLKTVELDPNFGLGYQGLASMSANLGRLEDADKYSGEALKHLDGVTERERLAVRASYYLRIGDYQQCVKEYGELIVQYAADVVAHANSALCQSNLRNMREAVDGMRRAVQILPRRVGFRANLAIYADYAGDFETAEKEATAIEVPNDLATLAVAFSHLGKGMASEAGDTYQKLAAIGPRGPTWSAAGLGDLAMYQGRFADAVRILEQGASADLMSKNPDRAARKLTSAAYAHLMRGQNGLAVATAEKALQTSKALPIRFLASRVFVEAGAIAKAQAEADSLASELPAKPQAYGKILQGEIALKKGDPRQAIKILSDAGGVLDTWLGHFDLGRAYLQLGEGALLQADSEFDRCIKRHGEALSLLVDEEPTYGHFPMVYYYQGLVREGMNNSRATESYREYLKIRGESKEDPLLPDVRKRAGS